MSISKRKILRHFVAERALSKQVFRAIIDENTICLGENHGKFIKKTKSHYYLGSSAYRNNIDSGWQRSHILCGV